MSKTRIFFATDVHGSEICFRKFVNAGEFYKADVLICAELTGKAIIPIVEQSDGTFKADFLNSKWVLKTEEEIKQLERAIANAGYYPHRTSLKEMDELADDNAKVDRLFTELMLDRLRNWIKLAEKRLGETGKEVYLLPGNDDRFELDNLFDISDCVIDPEGKVLEIDNYHEMISTGYANMTPWRCPRDISDEELSERIENMASHVKTMENCIFNFHTPPYGSNLDLAPVLDASLKQVTSAGQQLYAPVGSQAVSSLIKKYQPLLGLHGHIHESRGICKIGRTLCMNPGSEYNEGVLRGALVDVSPKKIESYILTRG